jgi:PPOX class probable FMN-dependent enzyme
MNDIPDYDALRTHMGAISPMAERKVLPALDRHCRAFIALSPFLVLASADAEGRADASPRGDPPGFVQVLDDRTLLLPDRPGNNRVDSFANILTAPGVGLIFFVPGIDETLRVNGTARLLADSESLNASSIAGKTPRTGLVIAVDEVFFHCAKALRRARLWDPAAQVERSSFPSLGRIIAEQTRVFSVEEAERRTEDAYRTRMY